jgi:hypothetical protein
MSENKNERLIKIRSGTGEVTLAKVSFSGRPYSIDFDHESVGKLTADGPDLFECLCRIRVQLEPLGFILLCAGARKDVYPSGMMRDMGGGRNAYVLRQGEQASLKNVVDIFNDCEIGDLATVSEQKANYENWLKSRGIKLKK